MPKRRWQLDDEALVHPTGRRIPLEAIEDWFRAAWGGNQTIQTDRWRGWRIVQQYLVPPGRGIRSGIHINAVRSLAEATARCLRIGDTDPFAQASKNDTEIAE